MLVANRRPPIRIKEIASPSAMSDSVVKHENIFLAKLKDSESTTCTCCAFSDSLLRQVLADRSCTMNEKHCSVSVSFNLDFHGCKQRGVFLHASRRCIHLSEARAVGHLRQLFLKLDDVFFDLLVYSE
jgi:hypothetical protein